MWIRAVFALVVSTLLSVRGLRKKSLSVDGAVAAFVTGLVHCFAGYDFTAVLATFFVSSSWLTKYKAEVKQKLEEDFKEGGQRNYIQVFANSATASICCLFYLYFIGWPLKAIDFDQNPLASYLICAFIGHYACCNGDTWASELGILSETDPWLITTGRKVPKGTNGAVSILGTGASAVAGLLIGIVYYVFSLLTAEGATIGNQIAVVVLGLFGGILGSILDSLLGATLQFSMLDPKSNKVISHYVKGGKHITGMDVLDNHMVNFVSSLLTAVLCSILAPILFF